MEVPSKQEFLELQQEVTDMRNIIHQLLLRVENAEPDKWLTKAEARTYFISKGKPVPASTFNEWINKWLANGTLKQNINCKFAGETLLICSSFIKQGHHEKVITHLKKAV